MSLKTSVGKDYWFLDSGCSKHMTGDSSKFISLKPTQGGEVVLGDDTRCKIIGIGKVGINSSSHINNVRMVDGLKHNLLSISQLCDKGYRVVFESSHCYVQNISNNKISFVGHRQDNIYAISLEDISTLETKCFISANDQSWLWHRRLGHVNMRLISNLSKNDLVLGLPKINFEKNHICNACQQGKQVKSSFQSKNVVSTSRPLELLHMDLFGPTKTYSLGGKRYGLVIVDDFSRYTWVLFLAHKDETFNAFEKFCKKGCAYQALEVIMEENLKITRI